MRTGWMVLVSAALLAAGCGAGLGGDEPAPTAAPTGAAPGAAACPSGATPDRPGDATQPRPGLPDWYRLAAMDPTDARVIVAETGFVPDGDGQATVQRVWAFDVCANSWTEQEGTSWPSDRERPALGQLVTDPAAGTLLGLATGLSPVWSFQPATSSWAALPTMGGGSDMAWPEAAYDTTADQVLAFDPNVIVADRAAGGSASGVLAYRLDAHAWTSLEPTDAVGAAVPQVRMDPYDVTYDSAADRLILVTSPQDRATGPGQTWAFDPATATWTRGDDVPDTLPGGHPAGGWATAFDPGTGRTWLFQDTAVLGYDARADDWVVAPRHAGWPGSMLLGGVQVDPVARSVDSMVADPINHRFVVLGGFVRPTGEPVGGDQRSMLATDDVWAYDPAANTWTMLLAPSDAPASYGPG